MFEDRQAFSNGFGLLGSGDAGPQGVEGGDVFVGGAGGLVEVVVEVHAALGVPEIFLDELFSFFGALLPALGVFFFRPRISLSCCKSFSVL